LYVEGKVVPVLICAQYRGDEWAWSWQYKHSSTQHKIEVSSQLQVTAALPWGKTPSFPVTLQMGVCDNSGAHPSASEERNGGNRNLDSGSIPRSSGNSVFSITTELSQLQLDFIPLFWAGISRLMGYLLTKCSMWSWNTGVRFLKTPCVLCTTEIASE
jgi:hypothetical protein